jgi:alpha-L-fucosidase
LKQEPQRWARGQWRDFVLKSVKATPQTKVTVLGQNGRVLEYRPEVIPAPTHQQGADGLHIRAMFAQRLQDNSRWPNPIVLKITNVEPALAPPKVITSDAKFDRNTRTAFLQGDLLDMGKNPNLEVGFEYRSIVGLDASDRSIPWIAGPSVTRSATGKFSLSVPNLNPQGVYEFRAWAKHPLLTIYGAEKRIPLQ